MNSQLFSLYNKVLTSYGEDSFPRISFSDDDNNEIVCDLEKLIKKKRKNIFYRIGSYLNRSIKEFQFFHSIPPIENNKVVRIAQLIAPLEKDNFSIKQIIKICKYIENHKKHWITEIDQKKATSFYIRHNKKLPCTLSVESSGEIFLILKTVIGEGGFKKVKYALSYDSQDLVANAVTPLKNQDFIETARTEARIGMQLKGSPYIVPYFYVGEYLSKHGAPKQKILQVLFNAGSLWDNLSEDVTFTTAQIKKIMKDILLGVQHMHDNQILHRDLKLENIFLHKEISENGDIIYHACIGDFGLCIKPSEIKSIVGTVGYVAPEMQQAVRSSKENSNQFKTISYAADLYSLGILFDRFLDAAWINAGLSEQDPKLDDTPEKLYYLSQKLQSKNPDQRGTIDEALELLEKINWDPFIAI